MHIGELSRRTGISVRMLRYYEQEGLLLPRRTASGYRAYDEADASLVRQLGQLQASGLKLAVIRPLLPCLRRDGSGFRPCTTVIASLRDELGAIEQRLAGLQASRDLLAGLLDEVS